MYNRHFIASTGTSGRRAVRRHSAVLGNFVCGLLRTTAAHEEVDAPTDASASCAAMIAALPIWTITSTSPWPPAHSVGQTRFRTLRIDHARLAPAMPTRNARSPPFTRWKHCGSPLASRVSCPACSANAAPARAASTLNCRQLARSRLHWTVCPRGRQPGPLDAAYCEAECRNGRSGSLRPRRFAAARAARLTKRRRPAHQLAELLRHTLRKPPAAAPETAACADPGRRRNGRLDFEIPRRRTAGPSPTMSDSCLPRLSDFARSPPNTSPRGDGEYDPNRVSTAQTLIAYGTAPT